jgi:hypothetical protein
MKRGAEYTAGYKAARSLWAIAALLAFGFGCYGGFTTALWVM